MKLGELDSDVAVEFCRVKGTEEEAAEEGFDDMNADPGAGALGGRADDKESFAADCSFSSFSIRSHSLRFSAHW